MIADELSDVRVGERLKHPRNDLLLKYLIGALSKLTYS
jgi:hypothetical protein